MHDQAEDSTVPPVHRRSWILEIAGLIAIAGFFIGIAWAWHTQVSNLITMSDFNQLEIGQTLDEVNTIFRMRGQKSSTSAPPSEVEYRWENSTDSMATVVFVNGKLVRKSSRNLP